MASRLGGDERTSEEEALALQGSLDIDPYAGLFRRVEEGEEVSGDVENRS